ncbi:Putative DNA-binding protein HU-beta (ACLAME 290) [hydrothermal vent metagenome]|uniref:DNA-binding protein HU-beta (ACLAME 290) n=1 Tax=hydrothermal vent metagenome TaxID=652676 RepID=A0A3B1D561_9ZZZZ
MNKSELIEKVSATLETTKAEAAKVVNAMLSTITSTLKKGQKVTIAGFGTFSVVKQKARKGKNPRTGETIKIRARKAPKFKAGKGLKETVGGKKK